MAKLSKDDVLKAVEEMSVLELSELVKALEEKFGVTAAAPMAAAPGTAPAPPRGPRGAKGEKTLFYTLV